MVEIGEKDLLKSDADINEYKISMFFVLQNYGKYLRRKHDEEREMLWYSTSKVKNTFTTQVRNIFIFMIIAVIVSFSSLFPFILKVHKGMNQVMGLFSYVSRDQLNSLAQRCEYFKETYLEENKKLREGGGDIDYKDYHSELGSDLDFISESQDIQFEKEFDQESFQNMPSDSSHSYKGDESLNQSYKKEIDKELENLENFDGAQQLTPQNKNKKPKKLINEKITPIQTETYLLSQTMKNIEQAEKDLLSQDSEEMKWKALHDFKEKFTQIYLTKSLITVFLMIVILTIEYIRTLTISDANKSALDHLNVLSRVNSKVKYIDTFTLETIALNKAIEIENSDMVDYYGKLIYDDLNSLSDGLTDNFQLNLDSYKTLFFKIRNENICSNFFLNKPYYNFTGKLFITFDGNILINITIDCESDEFFTKGLQTLLIKLSEDCRLLAKNSLADSSSTATSKLSITVQAKLKSINEYCKKLGYTIEFLMSQLMDNLLSLKNTITLWDYGMFFFQTLLSFVLYKVLWMPFVKNLEDRIWRAQGMVNMIPFEIIAENKQLMKSMIHAYFN